MVRKLFFRNYFDVKPLFYISIMLILITQIGWSQETIILQNSGEFVVPCGINQITVEAIGGGGSGGTRNSNGNASGGGGGAYSKKTISVIPGQSFNYVIGQGGYDPNNLNNDGFKGGATTFGENLVVADGGNGGTNAGSATSIGGNGGLAINSIGDVVYNGGKGGNGGLVRILVNGAYQTIDGNSGAGGGAAGSTGPGGNANQHIPGNGMLDLGGNGAPGAQGLINSVGADGLSYGGGGAGALRLVNTSRIKGGAGANGVIRITYTKILKDYCTSLITNNNTRPITQVVINDLTNNSSATNFVGYEKFCDLVNLTQGSTGLMTVKVNTRGNNTQRVTVFADWNQDGDFNDANETFTSSTTIQNSTGLDAANAQINIVVPYTALTGLTTIRVVTHNTTTTTSCGTTAMLGQIEDYVANIIEAEPCSVPSIQPSTLILSSNTTTLSGIFYESFPTPDSYLVVYSRTQTNAPNITNGVFYNVNQQIGNGYYVASNNSSTSFSTNFQIQSNSTYRVWVFAYNQYCVGGPLYNKINPAYNSINNSSVTYCIGNMSSTQFSSHYLTRVAFVGIINETLNTSTYSSNPRGYQDFTGLANFPIQERGEGVNISIQNNQLAVTQAWVDWNKDGTFSNSERVYTSGGTSIISTTFGFVIPNNQALGQYRVRIRIANSSGFTACSNNYTGETEDYLLTVIDKCSSNITSVVNGEQCGPGNVLISAYGNNSTTRYVWYTQENGGAPIATTTTRNWTTPHIEQTTTYWVAAASGSCESRVRKPVIAKISPLANISFFPENPVVCGENDMIRLTATGDTETVYLVNEDFENNTFGTLSKGWVQSNLTSTYRGQKEFKIQTSTVVPNYNVWFPAISSGESGNKFILSNSDLAGDAFDHFISTGSLNTTNFNTLYLTMKMYFSRYKDDNVNLDSEFVSIQVNPTGGAANNSWITIEKITQDVGIGTKFKTLTYDVSQYINIPNLKFRILYNGAYTDGLALDDIKVWGVKPLETSFEWYNSTNVNAFSDPQGLIPYIEGTKTVALYVKPAISQLSFNSFQFTATALLSNGCLTSKDITVGNKTKIWNGNISTNWDNDNNWLPIGKPSLENCVIIPSQSIVSGDSYDALAKNIVVKPTGILEVKPDNNLIIDENIKVENNGSVTIRDKATLLQIKDNFQNTGIVTIERNTPLMYRYGINYWGSPLTEASNYKLGNLIPNVAYKYSFDLRTWGTDGHFVKETDNTVMKSGKGYILEVPRNFPTLESGNRQVYQAKFIGTPFNGVLNLTLNTTTRPDTVADHSELNNLISNPYPSAIDASKLIFDPRNANKLDGTIYLWANVSGLSMDHTSPYYNPDYNYNYSNDDYIVMNIAGSVHPISANHQQTIYQYIGSGQGFFIKSLANNNNIVIDNSMRVKNENDIFYRTATNNLKSGITNDLVSKQILNTEFKQIWIDLKTDNKKIGQTLIGYHPEATEDYDFGLDSEILGLSVNNIYSIIPNKKLAIQTKNQIKEDETVALGILLNETGTHTISINNFTEHFNEYTVYLIDNKLKTVHNLNSGDYNFEAEKGKSDNRFEIRFSKKSTLQFEENRLNVYNKSEFKIESEKFKIKNIQIFDLSGKLIREIKNLDSKDYIFNFDKNNTTYILKVNLENGQIKNIKTIY